MKVNGRELVAGQTEVAVRGRRGRYTYLGTTQTSSGRTVLDLMGPVNSPHKAFHACYVEDVLRVKQSAIAR